MSRPLSSINGLTIHIPKSLEGVAPVSPNHSDFAYEPYSWLGLDAVLEPGSVVYDCGAAHGLMSVLAAKRATSGVIHAFEANPAVLPITRELFETNDAQIVLNAVCVGERSGLDVEFYGAPGLDCVASSRHPVVTRVHAEAATVRVPMIALDHYAAACGQWPTLLKLDVEGSEYVALQGATDILRRLPHLQIETHGSQMIGDGASVEGLCTLLESLGYPLFDLQRGEPTTAREFADAHPVLPGYLLASIRLRDAQFLAGLRHRHQALRTLHSDRERHHQAMQQARTLVNSDAPLAIPILEAVLSQSPSHAEAHYLLAFALQSTHSNPAKARTHYEQALALGFDAFWVHYNLGALLLDTPDRALAAEHLRKAEDLHPEHEGVRFYLAQLP
ncbi:MAG: FkbM family methyltransferase [Bryobacterales bacterium]|nr:FkbM family methyltransferase [Bryobacterales bacterium]